MPHNFGNNASDGYRAASYTYAPKWEKLMDYNPDHYPSRSAFYTLPTQHGSRWFLQVKGFGVLTINLESNWKDPRGRLKPMGVSALEKSEIGCAPNL